MSRLNRYLALDWGERRIGLAISDPSGTIASPAGHILRRAGKRPPIAEVIRRAEALEAMEFLINKVNETKTNKKFLESMNQ